MPKTKKKIACLRTFFIGAFILMTGIAELFLILANQPYNLGTKNDKVLRTFVGTVLILWIASGLWITLYGKFEPCRLESSIENDEYLEEADQID